MNLFVDDVRSPLDSTWMTARTVTEAIRMISRLDFDKISLDHDTGSIETFEPVARYIAAKYSERPAKAFPVVIIHSSNPVGSQTMKNILEDCGLQVKLQPRV